MQEREDELDFAREWGAATGAVDADLSLLPPLGRTLSNGPLAGGGRSARDTGVQGAASPPPTQLLEQRVAYQLCLCGHGSFLSPYHLELGDFLVYAGMAAALREGGAVCAACINAKLRRVDRWSRNWRAQLRAVLVLLDEVGRQVPPAAAPARRPRPPPPAPSPDRRANLGGMGRQVTRLERRASAASEPTALALVHLPTQEENKRLVLLVGCGEPSDWLLPPGATLLTPQACEAGSFQLAGFPEAEAATSRLLSFLLEAPPPPLQPQP